MARYSTSKNYTMRAIQHTDLIFRNAIPGDLNHIVTLLRQLWPSKEITPQSLSESFMKSFTLEGHIIRVSVFEERIVGLCSLYIRNNLKAEGNLANIDELVVDESMRGRQIGRLLLLDAEGIAKSLGCKVMGLESSFHRMDAHRFYEDNGYWKQGYYITRELK